MEILHWKGNTQGGPLQRGWRLQLSQKGLPSQLSVNHMYLLSAGLGASMDYRISFFYLLWLQRISALTEKVKKKARHQRVVRAGFRAGEWESGGWGRRNMEATGEEEEQGIKTKAALQLFPVAKKKSLVLSFAKTSRSDRHLKIFIISLNL